MLSFSPVKLLIVLVVAAILVGPDKVPQVARQLGAAWRAFRAFHERVEQEVRDTIPELPSTAELARLARSPVAFLNQLADLPKPGTLDSNGNGSNGAEPVSSNDLDDTEGSDRAGVDAVGGSGEAGVEGAGANDVDDRPPGAGTSTAGRSSDTTGGRPSGTSGATMPAPDPSMN